MASMAMLMDRAAATPAPEEADCDSWLIPMAFSGRNARQAAIDPALQQIDHGISELCFHTVPRAGIGNDFRAKK
jgi:hypothetical protein